MRRLVIIGALLGLALFPCPAAAATPDPTVSVSSVHYAGRGVIELDLSYSCAKPTTRVSAWAPYLSVELFQGRNRTWRYGALDPESVVITCDGLVRTVVIRVAADDGPRFRGGSVVISAWLDASYELARTHEWVEKYEGAQARFRVRHSG